MSDSEEEYGPIDSSWGSQIKKVEEPGWDSLIDKSIKIGPNGLGAGNLHRRGKNFKPIGEDLILAQRLNKPISKKKMQDAIRETEHNLALPKSNKSTSTTHSRKHSTNKQHSKTTVPSTTRVPVASNQGGGGSNWLQSSLVDVPFWGEATESTNIKPTAQAKPTSPMIQTPPINQTPLMKALPSKTPPSQSIQSRPPRRKDPNGVFTSGQSKPVESVWAKRTSHVQESSSSNDGWRVAAKDIVPFVNTGWGAVTEEKDEKKEWANTSWGEVTDTTADWGSFAELKTTNKTIPPATPPSSRPSWLTSIPAKESTATTSRFSNPSKQRYSDNAPMDIRPSNYRLDQTTPTLTTAPPPPPENNILITINVELSVSLKVSVDIRELDEPSQLAKEFGQENNIHAENVLAALTKLFTSQKETALKKKQLKLQRRVYPSQNKPRYYPQSNVYTKSSFNQQYVPPQTSPPPFARKVYY